MKHLFDGVAEFHVFELEDEGKVGYFLGKGFAEFTVWLIYVIAEVLEEY